MKQSYNRVRRASILGNVAYPKTTLCGSLVFGGSKVPHHGCMDVVERSLPWFFSIGGDRQGLSLSLYFRHLCSHSFHQPFSSPLLSFTTLCTPRYHENSRLVPGQMPPVPPAHVVVRIRGPSDSDPRDSVRRRHDRARVADRFQQRYRGWIRSRNAPVATDPSVSSESEATVRTVRVCTVRLGSR